MWASFVAVPDLLPEFECKPGSLIECELRGQSHDRKVHGFLLVGTTQLLSKGPGGAWVKVECLATSDSWFLTWCDSHGGDGRSLRLHLCTTPPETCSCTDGQKEREFHSESWRRVTRENVTQGDLSWNLPETELKDLGTLVDDFRRRTGTVRKRGNAAPYTGRGSGTPNYEFQETSKKVKFEEAHDKDSGDARSSLKEVTTERADSAGGASWLDAAPTNTLGETCGENMAKIAAEASAAARSALTSPLSPPSSPSECLPSPSAEVTNKEVDSGYSADALCNRHPNWNQVLAGKLRHVRNMEELGAVLEETLAMVPTQLGAYVSESQRVRPSLSAMLTSKAPSNLLPVNLNLVMATLGDCQYEHQVWARGVIHCLNFWSSFRIESGQHLDVPEFASQGQAEVVQQIWKQVEQRCSRLRASHMLGLNVNSCFEPCDPPVDLILRKVPFSEMQWGSALPPASVVGVLDPLTFSEGELAEALGDPQVLTLSAPRSVTRSRQMKVQATQSEFDDLCNSLFLNGIIEVADDEPVTDRLNHAVTVGVVPAVAVCPLSQKVCGYTLVFDARAVNDLFVPFPIEVDPIAYSSRRASFEDDGDLVVQWDLRNLALMVALPTPWRKFFTLCQSVNGEAVGRTKGSKVRVWLKVWPINFGSAGPLAIKCVRELLRRRVENVSPQVGMGSFWMWCAAFENLDALCREIHKAGLRDPQASKLVAKSLRQIVSGWEIVDSNGPFLPRAEVVESIFNVTMHFLQNGFFSHKRFEQWLCVTKNVALFTDGLFGFLTLCQSKANNLCEGDLLPAGMIEAMLTISFGVLICQMKVQFDVAPELVATRPGCKGPKIFASSEAASGGVTMEEFSGDKNLCASCGNELYHPCGSDWHVYPCASNCGAMMCAGECAAQHYRECPRKSFYVPVVALRLCDHKDLKEPFAREGLRLEENAAGACSDSKGEGSLQQLCDLERDSQLWCSIWRPSQTFSFDSRAPISTLEGKSSFGHTRQQAIQLRQFRKAYSYAVKAATEAVTCGRFFLLEIPYDSQLWESTEVKELLSLDVQCTYFCPCCWGGQKRGAQCLVHNIPGVGRAMASSYCWCQSLRESLEVNEVCPWPEKASCRLAQILKSLADEEMLLPAGKKEQTPANTVVAFLKPSLKNLQLQKDELALADAVLDLGASLSAMGIEDHTSRLAIFYSQMIWQERRNLVCKGICSDWMPPYPSHFHQWEKVSTLHCQDSTDETKVQLAGALLILSARKPTGRLQDVLLVTDDETACRELNVGASNCTERLEVLLQLGSLVLFTKAKVMALQTLPAWMPQGGP